MSQPLRESGRQDDGPRRGRDRVRRPSLLRTAFYTASTAIILLAGFVVPLPYIETQPGPARDIAPLVEIEGTEVTELTGTTSLLTIRNQEQAVIPALRVWLDPDRSLRPIHEVFPPELDRDDYHAGQRERFGRQFDIAAAVAAQAAGVEVELDTAVVIVNVVPDGPADGLLFRGDVVTAVDGEPLADAEELASITQRGTIGQALTLTVLRNGAELDVTAELGPLPGDDDARLGVVIEDGVEQLRLPFEVRLRDGVRIGGPSAGLMIAITVYDLLAEEDLLQGRTIAGTGSLGSDGTVGPVGGVPQKLRAAADQDADLVLVPQVQLEVARAHAPADLQVVGVVTLEDALDVLRSEAI